MSYELVYTTQARKDAKKLKGSPLANKARELLDLIRADPFSDPPLSKRLLEISREPIHGASTFSIDWFTKFMRMKR